jgi:hypothetical protein
MNLASLAVGDSPPTSRRRSPRRHVNWRARVMIDAPRFADAQVVDISEDGLGMTSDVRVREHQVYDLAVAIPSILEWDRFQVVQFKAMVKSVILSGSRFRIGLEFVAIGGAAKELIGMWMRQAV